MSDGPSNYAKYLIRRFETATDGYSWLGSYPPEDHAAIVTDYHGSKRKLMQYIADLEKGQTKK